jgi:hypothetical protein
MIYNKDERERAFATLQPIAFLLSASIDRRLRFWSKIFLRLDDEKCGSAF